MTVDQVYESIAKTRPILEADVINFLLKHLPGKEQVYIYESHVRRSPVNRLSHTCMYINFHCVTCWLPLLYKQQAEMVSFAGDVDRLGDADKLYVKVSTHAVVIARNSPFTT